MSNINFKDLFKPAQKSEKPLKCAIQGPSGAGKTWGALTLAKGMGCKRIALLDTENKSASLYADRIAFDVAPMTHFNPNHGIEVIRAVAEAKYDVLIIDSLSHFWIGPGGILQTKEKVDAQGGGKSGFANWAKLTPVWDSLIREIVNAPMHVICTMRSKQSHAQEKDESTGRTVVRKLGLEPQIRDGVEYEFDVVLDINRDHTFTAAKDRLGVFKTEALGVAHSPLDLDVGKQIMSSLRGTPVSEVETKRATLDSKTENVSGQKDEVPF